MKIFGFEIGSPKPEVVEDQVPEVKAPIPQSKRPALIPPIRDPALSYSLNKYSGRGAFKQAEYDLAEVGRVEDTDGYVRQAYDKKVALMFKEGWDIVGPDPKVVRYIKTRFEQIATASNIPTKELMRRLGSCLIRQSNAFVIKVRDVKASGGQVRKPPGKRKQLKPVAGYFPAAAETMEFESQAGRMTSWRQRMPDGDKKEHPLDNIIHLHHDRKEGFVFGTPLTVPLIDDIRALRKIEENVEMLVYQHLFPLFQYKVGTPEEPAGVDEDGRLEVDVIRSEIRHMPSEGGIVTPHRHEILAIGAEGRALNAEKYLDHFKKRVFSGLGVSAVDMGEGETANRATADNMSRNLIDAVKDYQQIFESFVNEFIIKELLLESTFGPEVLDEEMRCWMKFREIDIDAQIKKEAHLADQFSKDILTLNEARISAGREPILIPTPDEIETGKDLSQKYPEWYNTRWKLFQEPTLLIQALDEPYSPIAKTIAKNNSMETTSKDIEEAGEEKKKQEIELEKERGKAKVAVAKATPRVGATRPSKPKKAKVTNGYLKETFLSIKTNVVTRGELQFNVNQDWLSQLIRTQMSTAIDTLIIEQMLAFRNGYSSQAYAGDTLFIERAAVIRAALRERAEKYVTKLTNHLVSKIQRSDGSAAELRAAFDSLEYRTDFIEDVEIRKARTLGEVIALRDVHGVEEMQTHSQELFACDRCKSEQLRVIQTSTITLDDLPPFHASCHCAISPVETNEKVADSVEPNEDEVEEQDSKESDFNRCKIRVAATLRREHPDWDEDMIKAMSETACEHIRARGK